MNIMRSVERLPEAIKRLILSDPAVKAGRLTGMELADVLSDPEWAEAWFRRCRDDGQLSVLRGVLRKYGANPFELERIAARAEEEFGMTGAEARVAVAKLRRSGIVFAVRKSWGDRLFYVPDDAVALWQPLLLPADNRPLDPDEAREVVPNAARYRQPLALELLSAWHEIARKPIVRTAKGAPQAAAVDRLTKAMGLEPDDLAGLLPPYPYAELLPPQAMLALDLGLACGVLAERDGAIGARDDVLLGWLALSRLEAERRLRKMVIARYCSVDPAFHLGVSAALALDDGRWHTEGRISEWQSREEAGRRLAILEAFGWIERGEWRGRTVIRKRAEPGGDDEPGEDAFIVQPDGEILVPPEVGLRTRWTLLDLAEMAQADALCVYRLTKRSCERAHRLGYSLRKALDFLERSSGDPVPEPVYAALNDWFASLGRTELVEALVLRTDGKELADALAEDPEMARMIVERIGDVHFLVDSACGKRIRARLRQVGFPALDAALPAPGALPGEGADDIGSSSDAVLAAQGALGGANGGKRARAAESRREEGPAAAAGRKGESPAPEGERGWIGAGPILYSFEADREVPGANELFPGLGDIPSSWVTRPRKYHPSTSKELIKRAIEWQTAVRLELNGDIRMFAPRGMSERGASWVAEGRWRPTEEGSKSVGAESEAAFVRAEDVAGLMIVLPDLEALETD